MLNENIKKQIRELEIAIMEDFISKDGKMSLDEIKEYKQLNNFTDMMFDLSFKDNTCDYLGKYLEHLKSEEA